MTDQTRADFEAHFGLTTRQAWQHKDGSYKFPEIQAKWEGYLAGVAKAAPEAVQEPLPRFMLEKVQQAIKEATHPKGMSLHDGKAKIDASILSRLLALAAAALAKRHAPLLDELLAAAERDGVTRLPIPAWDDEPVAAAAPGAVPDERKPVAWLSDNGFLISAAQKATAIEKGDIWHLGYHRPLYE